MKISHVKGSDAESLRYGNRSLVSNLYSLRISSQWYVVGYIIPTIQWLG